MSIKNKLKKNKFISKIKKIEKPQKEKSNIRKDSSKRIAFFIWSLILGMLFVGIVSILLSINTRSVLNGLNEKVESSGSKEMEDEIPIESANEFLTSFIKEYINIENTTEALEERSKNLKEFMIYNDEFNNDKHYLYNLEKLKGDRELSSFSLFHVEDNGDEQLFKYKVTFKNIVEKEVEKEVTKGKGKKKKKKTETEIEKEEEENTLLINIPIVYEGGLFSVKTVPYFTEVPSLAGNIEYESEDEELEEYNGNKKEDLIEFINTFFEKYSTEPIDEMAYMMEEPETLKGSFLFGEVKDLKLFEKEEDYIAYGEVVFIDELTNITQVNEVEIVISENGENYYVEKFNYD